MPRPLVGPLDGRGPREAARVTGEAVRVVRAGVPHGAARVAGITAEAVRATRVGVPRETARLAAEGAEAVREHLRLQGAWSPQRAPLPSQRGRTGRRRTRLRSGRTHLGEARLRSGWPQTSRRVKSMTSTVDRMTSRVDRMSSLAARRVRRLEGVQRRIGRPTRGLVNAALGVVGRPWLPGRQRAALPSSAGTAIRIALGAAIAAVASWTAVAAFLVWWRGRIDEGDQPADAVVVLGAAQRDGVPSRVFVARLNHAVELIQRGTAPCLIVTGGVDTPGGPSEADVARAYAVERGVPAEAILAETGGRSTLESLRNVALLMQEHGLGRAILVSDRTHMLRTMLIARRLGMQVAGSPTRTSPADRQLAARLRATRHEIGALAGLAVRAPRI